MWKAGKERADAAKKKKHRRSETFNLHHRAIHHIMRDSPPRAHYS